MSDIENELTPQEVAFLARLNLTADDVMDVRWMSSDHWKVRIKQEGKQIALGSSCRKAGHRLRTTAGHCVQCDIKKFQFVKRFSAEQYVYIAGAKSARVIKFGTGVDWRQRERQIKAERYGDVGDWKVLYAVKVQDAGRVEWDAHQKLRGLGVSASYIKDGYVQDANEMLKCSFSMAKQVLDAVSEGKRVEGAWVSRFTSNYEFTD